MPIEVTRPPSTGSCPLEIDYLHAIWQALLTSSGNLQTMTTINLIASVAGSTISDSELQGLPLNKIVYIERAGLLLTIVESNPNVRECVVNNITGSIIVSDDEPFFYNEQLTLRKIN